MKTRFLVAALSGALLAADPAPAALAAPQVTDAGSWLSQRIVRLENGVTAVLMPDDTVPNVGVELWIRGGAREERPGQFGVAHLFEHQLAGSSTPRLDGNPENRALAARTSRGSGAGTDFDYINIYRVVSPEGLEVQLADYAEQLSAHADQFTSRRLETDKNVVISELRRNSSLEWNLEVYNRRQRGTFGADHPHGHAISGAEGDVKAATVPLMREWLKRGMGGGVVVFVVGNFDPVAAEAMVRRHFDPLAPGEAQPRDRPPVPVATGWHETIEAPFPTGAVFMSWPTPGWGTEDGDRLALLSTVLNGRLAGSGAGDPRSGVQQFELAGVFELSGDALDPEGAAQAEARLAAALQSLLREGLSAEELDRAKARWKTDFLLSLQEPVWRGSRAEAVGRGLLFHDNPDQFRVRMARIAAATPEELRDAGRRWLDRPGYVLHALPQGSTTAAAAPAQQQVEAGPTIPPGPSRAPRLPTVETVALGSGKLLTAALPNSPLTRVTVAFPAGYASDGSISGRARTVLSALPQVKLASGVTLADGISALGGSLETQLDADFASLTFTVVNEQVDAGVTRVLEALSRGPSEADFAEALTAQRTQAAAARGTPSIRRFDLAACAVFDPCTPGMLNGTGDPQALSALSGADLADFYRGRYNAANVVAIVSGAADRARLQALIEAGLPDGPAAPPPTAWTTRQTFAPPVQVIDTPGATQATLLLVQPLPAGLLSDPAPAELTTLLFRQRVMQVLRTEKGWSYEPYPYGNRIGRSGSYLYMNLPVQTDKVALAMREVEAEAEKLRTSPLDARFLSTNRGYQEGGIVRGLTSLNEMNAQLLERERGGLPADYYAAALRALPDVSPDQVQALAGEVLRPDRSVWVIVGDLSQLRPALEAGQIQYEIVGPTT